MVVMGFLSCICTSGSIFGYASLSTALRASGMYADLCEGDRTCDKQRLRMDLMFTLASTAVNVACLFVGMILDRYGPKVTCISGALIYAAGCTMFGSALQTGQDLFIPAFMLMAIGGPFVFLSTLHLSQAIPAHSSLIMSSLTCAFDASSVIFFVFALIYNRYNVELEDIFYGYNLVLGVILLFGIFVMPMSSFTQSLPGSESNASDDVDSIEDDDDKDGDLNERVSFLAPKKGDDVEKSAVSPTPTPTTLHDLTIYQQLYTPEFLLLVLFMSVYMLRLNSYVGSVFDQLKSIFLLNKSSGSTDLPLKVFGIMLPLGPFVAIPLITFLLHHLRMSMVYMILTLMIGAFDVITLVPNIDAQYAGWAIFVLVRSMIYAAANEYAARTFGFRTFGRIYGTMMFISGLCQLLQLLVNHLAIVVLKGDFFYLNLFMTILCFVVGVGFSYFLYRKESRKL